MSEVILTPSQREAVDNQGGSILVSAAAGSGKTKVLVDRLMRSVCDPDSPKNINEFLMITYTKAAAAELRGKISAELGKRLALAPGNRHLQKQLSLIYLTEISTVHAFCANLLRTYAHVLNLSPDFRVAEEGECAALRQRCLDQVLEEAYSHLQETPDIRSMIDILGYGRDDRGVAAAVWTLYGAVQCHPYPEKWRQDCMTALEISAEADCGETVWGAELIEQFQQFLELQIRAMECAAAEMNGIPALEKAYLPRFLENLEQLRAMRGCGRWDEIAAAIPVSFGRLGAVRNFEEPALLERLKGVRSRCLDGLKDWNTVFYGTNREVMTDLMSSAAALRGALEVVRRVTERYAAEKKRRRILDFGDLEHLAIRLLIDSATGGPTAAAREVAARYVEVMIDEYQDSNEVQEQIFKAVSKDDANRFMVGDVKQSIYRFRLADPGIFLQKYKSYDAADAAAQGAPRKILLSENFRSRPEILSAVNHVFRTVMSEQVGDLTYGEQEALRAGRAFPPIGAPVVELHCMEPMAGESEEDAPDKGRTEARFVAERIAALLADGTIEEADGKRPVQPEDIVILLRSVNSAAPDYLNALRAKGIPCVCDRGESVLDSREVEVALSVLQIIDNPHRDLPLTSALLSPVFQFTAEDLAVIRANYRSGDFYDALCRYAETDEKCGVFLETLQILREQSKWLPLPALLRRVYEVTRIERIFGAAADGARRKANLQAFFEYAVQASSGSGATLMTFLSETEQKQRQGLSLTAGAQTQGGAVQIMSVHKSKGLEFPVVVLADLSRRFNTEDQRQQVMAHPRLYVASNILDLENGVRFPSVAKKAVSMRLQRESLSEELRVLYVAMTRAKERLIMTYCSRYLQTELRSIALEASMPASPEFAARAKNPGWWVLMAAMCRTEAGELFTYGDNPRTASVFEDPWDIRVHTELVEQTRVIPSFTNENTAPDLPDLPEIQRRLSFQYPYGAASAVPSKLTATQLKGRRIDQEASEDAAELVTQRRKKIRRPQFVQARRGLTPMEKGTANHLFLQFADYRQCTDAAAIDAELRRMVAQEFLSPEQAVAVEREQILQLFHAPLGREILESLHVIREFKFSLLVDAGAYYPDVAGERLMLQGVVDCILEESDGLTVIDFKTDAIAPGAEGERAQFYCGQLAAYAKALSRIYRKPVKRQILYFFKTGCSIALTET